MSVQTPLILSQISSRLHLHNFLPTETPKPTRRNLTTYNIQASLAAALLLLQPILAFNKINIRETSVDFTFEEEFCIFGKYGTKDNILREALLSEINRKNLNIQLNDPSCTLLFASPHLKNSIFLNGGTLILPSTLKLHQKAQLVGPGNIVLNNQQTELYCNPFCGTLRFEGNISFVQRKSFAMPKTELFFAEQEILWEGNNYTLDISTQTKIIATNNTCLTFSNVFLRLNDPNSLQITDQAKIRFINVMLETPSGIVFLEADDWTTLQKTNFTPTEEFRRRDLTTGKSTLQLNNTINTSSPNTVYYELEHVLELGIEQKLTFPEPQKNYVIDGLGYEIIFPQIVEPFIITANNSYITFKNCTLVNFNAQCLALGQGAKICFAEHTHLILAENWIIEKPGNFEFCEETLVTGNNNSIILKSAQALTIRENSKLTTENTFLNIENADAISAKGTLCLNNVHLRLGTEGFRWPAGKMTIEDTVQVTSLFYKTGSLNTIFYSSTEPLEIETGAFLKFFRGTELSFDKTTTPNVSILLKDASSILALSGSCIDLAGKTLTVNTGKLWIDGKTEIYSSCTSGVLCLEKDCTAKISNKSSLTMRNATLRYT